MLVLAQVNRSLERKDVWASDTSNNLFKSNKEKKIEGKGPQLSYLQQCRVNKSPALKEEVAVSYKMFANLLLMSFYYKINF